MHLRIILVLWLELDYITRIIWKELITLQCEYIVPSRYKQVISYLFKFSFIFLINVLN